MNRYAYKKFQRQYRYWKAFVFDFLIWFLSLSIQILRTFFPFIHLIKTHVSNRFLSFDNKVLTFFFHLCCLLTVHLTLKIVHKFWWEFLPLGKCQYWEITHRWFQNIQHLSVICSKALLMLIVGFCPRSSFFIALEDNTKEINNLQISKVISSKCWWVH